MPITQKEFLEAPKYNLDYKEAIVDFFNKNKESAYNVKEIAEGLQIREHNITVVLKLLRESNVILFCKAYGRFYYQLASNGFRTKEESQ